MNISHHVFRFKGGVHPPDNKALARDAAITPLPLPKRLAISMSQHLGAPATCCVTVGEHVAEGQRIGTRSGVISVPVHAPAAGTVRAIKPRPGPTGAWTPAVILETDDDQSATPPVRLPPLDGRTAAPADLLARIGEAGLCGMGGAGFPTAVKLAPPPGAHCDFLILNGAECEPYLTADFRMMVEEAARIRAGVEIMRRLLGGPAVRIAVEANKPEAVAALEAAFADAEGDVQIVVLPVLYPQGSEKHQIYAVTGRRVPPGALPISVGCVVENISTVAALADAVERGLPLTSRVTTVTGDGVVTPRNVRAPIGTSYADLVAFCGGAKPTVRKVVSGGPMMGFAVPHLDVATTKTTSGILLLTDERVFRYASAPCINCGRCLRACPMRLEPAAISRAVEANDIDAAARLGVMNCLECGACAYGCPAYRPLTALCRRAKNILRAQKKK